MIILATAAVAAFGYFAYFVYQVSAPAGHSLEEAVFAIEKGEGVNEISRNLKSAGLIRSSWDFEFYVWARRMEGKMQAGQYSLGKNMSIREVTSVLVSGKALPNEKIIKIPEGWTAREIGKYLEEQGIGTQQEFLDKIRNYDPAARDYWFLESIPEGGSLEGFLFPDTYRIYKDATADDVIGKMLENFSRKVMPEMRQDTESQKKNVFEIVTLASVIEKEVPDYGDREMVADVFYKRLAIGMPLESCATVAYALGVSKKQYTIDDTRTESPYNTYLNKGLPPGPIGNPSLSAIRAAIYPKKNDYWFFLSNDQGETIFSRTLQEHNANKAKWLR